MFFPVRLVINENINIFDPPHTWDSNLLWRGDRVLVMGQINMQENGIYVVKQSGWWVRADDLSKPSQMCIGGNIYDTNTKSWFVLVSDAHQFPMMKFISYAAYFMEHKSLKKVQHVKYDLPFCYASLPDRLYQLRLFSKTNNDVYQHFYVNIKQPFLQFHPWSQLQMDEKKNNNTKRKKNKKNKQKKKHKDYVLMINPEKKLLHCNHKDAYIVIW